MLSRQKSNDLYSHARAASVLRKAGEDASEIGKEINAEYIKDGVAYELAKSDRLT